MNAKNILIIGAHFDDADLGVGGVGAKYAEQGKNVYKLTLTDNVTNFRQMKIKVDQKSSSVSSANACKALGIKEITDFVPSRCNELAYTKNVMQAVEAIIFDNHIDPVFMHFNHDINQDHIAASTICLTAARHCRNLLAYQSNNYICEQNYYPTYFIDISSQIEKKIRALEAYGKEHNRFDRLFQSKIELNHVWGAQNKVEYAEGFHVIKILED